MWIEIAHFATIAALLVALTQIAAPLVGITLGRPVWIRVGRQAAFTSAALLTLACAGLILSFLKHDFSVAYVADHASLDLPIFYLATAMWGGHEGSLLLWAWFLSLFIAFAAWRHWRTHPLSIPYVLAILGTVLAGFLLLVIFLSSPFERMLPPPPDGRDLNPLLQDPGMVFHPPFLYMGYVGFGIPYAFAMAALLTGRVEEEWILATRRWTLFSWAMLTTGIVFGAYWAYYELGWGGYWAWDPVENASFMPWLTATAFLHSVMVQERRQLFKTWNLFLITTTFALSLLGTFLVRSGVLSSVHAFANDPGRGVYILVFMAVLLLFSFGLLVAKADSLKVEARLESPLSRESAFLFNNLFLLVATATVLLGTLYPLAIETLTEAKVSVGSPYYNKVFIPIMLGLLLLMGVGPVIPWRRVDRTRLLRALLVPTLAGIGATALALGMGIAHPYGVATAALIGFVAVSHGRDFIAALRARTGRSGDSILLAPFRLIGRNKRRYGGFVVHVGILVMAAGFIGSGLFQEEQDLLMKVGDSTTLGRWRLTFTGIGQVSRHNWDAVEASFVVEGPGGQLLLKPQKRQYHRNDMPTTEAAIHSTWREDLYIVLGDRVDDRWAIRCYRNPLIVWIWWGAGLMALGVVVSLGQGRGLKRRDS
ncbi:MAG: heme lyase CcmF/NrfE family subunit [Magnetococcales bacterium]|nr:heme lyase CcmF/NrfE family subunit [Magnetococcales bacterium]MBF0157666.1 heme lyase CcmF/NrfE family subunit [Magnetococcales bacterium]